jgi:hypothetical protein
MASVEKVLCCSLCCRLQSTEHPIIRRGMHDYYSGVAKSNHQTTFTITAITLHLIADTTNFVLLNFSGCNIG